MVNTIAVESLVAIYMGPISVFYVAGGLAGYSQFSQFAHMAVGCVSAVLMSLSLSIPLSIGLRWADGHLLRHKLHYLLLRINGCTLSIAPCAHAFTLATQSLLVAEGF